MSFQNGGQVRQKSLLCAIQPPFSFQTALHLISQSLTSRCTNYYYFYSQKRIYLPRLENALRAAKTFRQSREGYIMLYREEKTLMSIKQGITILFISLETW